MKSRSLLLLVGLLLSASLASAAQTQTSTPADPASASLAAILTAPAAPDVGAAKLPSFMPAPMDKAVLCGSCSDTVCQGRHFGDTCGFKNGQTYRSPRTRSAPPMTASAGPGRSRKLPDSFRVCPGGSPGHTAVGASYRPEVAAS